MTDLNTFAVGDLINSSLLATLISTLAADGVLSDRETYELYEQALLKIEETQSGADTPDYEAMCIAARGIIENALSEMGPPHGGTKDPE